MSFVNLLIASPISFNYRTYFLRTWVFRLQMSEWKFLVYNVFVFDKTFCIVLQVCEITGTLYHMFQRVDHSLSQ